MGNIIECKLESTYKEIYTGLWQHDYGQILRITGVEFPKAVEIQFSLNEKSGSVITRIGTTTDGVTEVRIPDELLKNEGKSQDYSIYAYIYLTDESSGNTEYQIILHVKSRPKPEEPTEEPLPEPNIFHETVEAVNAAADRAETAAESAEKSATSASETLEEIKRVTDGISEDIENANTAKSELSGMIESADDKKTELESTTEKASGVKSALDGSIESAGEKQTDLDVTVTQANTVDASLKEQIGSAGAIQENVKQIEKNKQDISSLNKEVTKNTANDADTKRKLDALWKLNQGISYEFQTDDTEAYQKTIPSGAKLASVKKIGGKTIARNRLDNEGTLMSIPVNEVVEQGKNYFDFSKLVSDGVNVMDYEKQTITVPAKTNNTGYNQTLRDLCPGITPGTYVFSMKRSNPNSGNGSYFLEASKDFPVDTPIELTGELLDNHISWYNSDTSEVENVISEIQIEKNSVETSYSQYY